MQRQIAKHPFNSTQSHSSVGRLHKYRDSFGPTLCLTSKNNEHHKTQQFEEDKQIILLLSLEIERLQILITQIKKASSGSLKQYTDQISRLQNDLRHFIDNREEIEIVKRQSQAQKNVWNRRVKEQDDKINMLDKKIILLQDEIQRERFKLSQRNMQLKDSQAQLQKSAFRQFNSFERLKQKVTMYEEVMTEQKRYIDQIQIQNNKLQAENAQIIQNHEYQVALLKNQKYNFQKRLETLEKQIINQDQNLTKSNLKQTLICTQIDHLKDLLKHSQHLNQQLSNKNLALKQQLERNIIQLAQLRDQRKKITEAPTAQFNEGQDSKNYQRQLIQLGAKFKHYQIASEQNRIVLLRQIQILKEQLQIKQYQLKKLSKKQKNIETSNRLVKSFSESNLGLKAHDPRYASSATHDISQIISNVIQLQNSQARIASLIDNKTSYLKLRSFGKYGL